MSGLLVGGRRPGRPRRGRGARRTEWVSELGRGARELQTLWCLRAEVREGCRATAQVAPIDGRGLARPGGRWAPASGGPGQNLAPGPGVAIRVPKMPASRPAVFLSSRRAMSQTQFVEYGEDWFWAYDVGLGVFLKHVIDVAQERSDEPGEEWPTDSLLEWWRVVATTSGYGLSLGEGWSAPQTARFLFLSREACARIRRRDVFSAAELQDWSILDGRGVFARGASEVLAGPVVELGDAIIARVEGSLPAAPAGTAWCYGTPDGRITILMKPPA